MGFPNFQSLRRVLIAAALTLAPAPALADFHLCNNTGSRVGIAIGYKDADGGWTTEGWWNLSARSCETLLKGTLVARFYYIYAIDYDRGGEWSGQAFMCSRDKEFTIKGTENCLARGFDRTGFFEVDTGEQRAWTVQLTETAEQGPRQAEIGHFHLAGTSVNQDFTHLKILTSSGFKMTSLASTKLVSALPTASLKSNSF
mgnify:CR=1 FL=1